ncbi:unnamed protein product [Vitrella brassicaformis CCMP3155]|uniref:Protein phosphatase 1 regulatory subunit 7 n=1 Tax=Vitrella brassicaformis (strain CCMP3155) TaxID=1169540 RepID=A0A0G4EV32_VITBC|nr:unnamed protein product [Vitrella brassicaformis CCMP3155]|eukprot:CEM02466.1 unnamed protein product [Vitrella brassicaformis CCMP3155]
MDTDSHPPSFMESDPAVRREQEDSGGRVNTDEDENEAEEEPVTYLRLGVDYEVDPADTDISIQCGRIRKFENLEQCTNLQSLCLIANHVRALENLEHNIHLTRLELYQNAITQIANISHLTQLRVLDLSFNQIRKIENIETLVQLEKLYLSSNKITKIEGLDNLVGLKLLELGSNRIRVIEGVSQLQQLEELHLGKNKITSMALPVLPRLTTLTLQSNRLEEWDASVFANTGLQELYLSHNALSNVPQDICRLVELETLDLASNKIGDLAPLAGLMKVEDLWMNDNAVEDIKQVEHLKAITSLKTLYLERCPLQYKLGPGYRMAVTSTLPGLNQLDAAEVRATITVHTRPLVGRVGQRAGGADRKEGGVVKSIMKR